MKNYYKILGIPCNSTPQQIKKAFRDKALKFHPDRHRNCSIVDTTEAMKAINEANEILSDPETRKKYDETFTSQSGLQNPEPLFLKSTTFFSPKKNDVEKNVEKDAEKDVENDEEIRVNLPTAVIFTQAPVNKSGHCKVIMLGSPKACKSTFLINLQDEFLVDPSILGVDFRSIAVSSNFKVQIWDTAGQERFKSIAASYYRDAAIILIFDNIQGYASDFIARTNTDLSKSQAFTVSYSEGECQLNPIIDLNAMPNLNMQSADSCTAQTLGNALLAKCEEVFVNCNTNRQAQESNLLELNAAAPVHQNRRRGCCN